MPSARAAKVQLLIDRNAAAAGLVEVVRASGLVLLTDVPGVMDASVGANVSDTSWKVSGCDNRVLPPVSVARTCTVVMRPPASSEIADSSKG